MARNATVEPEQMVAYMEGLLTNIANGVVDESEDAVKAGARMAAREWRKNARSTFGGTGKYAKSIRSKLTKGGVNPSAEAGSASMPGLSHLLEKGHARVGGGRVAGRPHIAPAAEVAFDYTEELMGKAIERVLNDA